MFSSFFHFIPLNTNRECYKLCYICFLIRILHAMQTNALLRSRSTVLLYAKQWKLAIVLVIRLATTLWALRLLKFTLAISYRWLKIIHKFNMVILLGFIFFRSKSEISSWIARSLFRLKTLWHFEQVWKRFCLIHSLI